MLRHFYSCCGFPMSLFRSYTRFNKKNYSCQLYTSAWFVVLFTLVHNNLAKYFTYHDYFTKAITATIALMLTFAIKRSKSFEDFSFAVFGRLNYFDHASQVYWNNSIVKRLKKKRKNFRTNVSRRTRVFGTHTIKEVKKKQCGLFDSLFFYFFCSAKRKLRKLHFPIKPLNKREDNFQLKFLLWKKTRICFHAHPQPAGCTEQKKHSFARAFFTSKTSLVFFRTFLFFSENVVFCFLLFSFCFFWDNLTT